ncbi:copper resistance-associated p-type atpase [Ceraceosorus bombacis]|uniref:Copper resistance-associated P-type atpase n=1 Tax=Ceraceosorus bombacis TaxID=401625 RepID=A0A0P1BF12_9BASI|nr:copper resistance-associated p-type atpase [Ceraceosorus bombacis]
MLRTTLAIPAIHCPSCVEHIRSLLSSLSHRIEASVSVSGITACSASSAKKQGLSATKPIADVSVSLIDSTVSFTHPACPQKAPTSSTLDKAYVISLLSQVHDALGADGYTPQGAETREVGARPSHGRSLSLPWLDSVQAFDADLPVNATTSPSPALPTSSSFSASLSNLRSLVNTFRHDTEGKHKGNAVRTEERWKRHLEACVACRAEAQHTVNRRPGHTASFETQSSDGPDESLGQPSEAFNVTLAVGGMTCASCTNAVTAAAESLNSPHLPARVRDFSVELLSNSARARVSSKKDAEALRSAIEDAGYDATLVSIASTSLSMNKQQSRQHPTRDHSSGPPVWLANLAIGGMTCASCVGNVTGVVKASVSDKILIEFNVSLLENGASAKLRADDNIEAQKVAKEICRAIQDSGYDAELAGLELDAAPDGHLPHDGVLERSARIRVDGMFCNHCVIKVQRHLSAMMEDFGPAFSVEQDDVTAFSLSRPVISVCYLPSRKLNLRSIIKALQDLDPAFSVEHVRAPSLASRSAKLARKELTNYIVRLAIACMFVPPTLVLGVIAPMLSSHHPLRHTFDRPVWGGASLGEVSLWLLATPVQFGVGSLFYTRSIKSFKSVWRPGRSWSERLLRWGNMEVLVALGTSISYFASLGFTLVNVVRGASAPSGESMTFFDTSVFLIAFILLGRVLEAWSKRKTGDSVAALGALRPSKGLLVLSDCEPPENTGGTEEVGVELLEVGDLVLVPTGSSPPLDSVLVITSDSRRALFDESSLTGESLPAVKGDGDQLYAGTVNVSSHPVTARVTAVVGDQLLDGILDVVRSASSRKASLERIADRVTSMFVPLIVYTAVIVLCTWLLLLNYVLSPAWIQSMVPHSAEPGARFIFALRFAISFVVVACPCGIGLAAPTAQMAGIGLASKYGILANGGGEAFQSASQSGVRKTIVVFDKTGTLTEGVGQVVDTITLPSDGSLSENRVWAALDITEQNSSHPLADALRDHCAKFSTASANSKSSLKLRDVQELSGKGLHARFDLAEGDIQSSFELYVGNRRLLGEAGCDQLCAEVMSTVESWQAKAWSPVFVAIRSEKNVAIRAVLAVADPVRTEAKALVAWLHRQAIEPWIVSGDAEAVAKAVGAQIGIRPENIVAGVLPAGKEETIRRIQDDGGEGAGIKVRHSRSCSRGPSRGALAPLVFFVGDGINDAPALTAADVGIAMGSGSAIASTSADFILLSPNAPLSSIPSLISLSRATTNKVLQNFVWAAAFNLTLLPTAAGILMPLGFELPPSLSGLAMAVSSTSVVLNALTLRLWRPPAALESSETTPLLRS